MITFALYGLIIILSMSLILHLCVILKIIPYRIVWGGRLTSDKQMYRFEVVSIVVTLFMLFVILVHANTFSFHFSKSIMKVFFWILALLFLLNTFGNILSKNKIERIVFSPMTILLTIFSVILALNI